MHLPLLRSAQPHLRFGKYAIVGGGACMMLGNTRTTEDVDFVVPRGETAAACQSLRASSDFEIEPRTNHTKFKADGSSVEIQILAPPTLFRESFDETTEVITIKNVKVSKSELLLIAKCRSMVERPGAEKRATDQADILFLLRYCVEHPEFLPRFGEVPNATLAFVNLFIQQYGSQDIWVGAGYDLNHGLKGPKLLAVTPH
ncbi:hypothetical protein BDV06DRAFT_210966 [Aspergillus oleicola]